MVGMLEAKIYTPEDAPEYLDHADKRFWCCGAKVGYREGLEQALRVARDCCYTVRMQCKIENILKELDKNG